MAGPDETLHCGQLTICLKAPFTAPSNRAETPTDNWHQNPGNPEEPSVGHTQEPSMPFSPGQARTRDSAHMHVLGLALNPRALSPRRADSATRRDYAATLLSHLYSGLSSGSWEPPCAFLHTQPEGKVMRLVLANGL